MIVIHIILLLLFTGLALQVFYIFVCAIAGHWNSRNIESTAAPSVRFLVLVPAYKEDQVILKTVEAAANIDYPAALFRVMVIADSLMAETISTIEQKAQVLEVKFEKSTKGKSLKQAFAWLQQSEHSHDYVLILDADNIAAADCLKKASTAISRGHTVIQLHRTAKNLNTPTALLDAISEEINNHIFRKGVQNLGGSAALIGSGMVFPYAYISRIFLDTNISENPGEDKELEDHLLKDGLVCNYINNALVLDEKVQSLDVLENQRVRWISAQMAMIKKHFYEDFSQLFTTNGQYFFKAIQYLILPRLYLVAIINFLAVAAFAGHLAGYDNPFLHWKTWIWLAAAFDFSILISIPRSFFSTKLLRAIILLPASISSMIRATRRSGFNQKEFIHTKKNFNQPDNSSSR